MGKAGSAI
uniref:Uncharacterized protein n=1 Tax=Oryza sativa subsp. japonica TaxID=39947 RepID=Q2QPG3_ORYSJ|nr:hypothetical protein LOC_Os12g34569 [Oryza sativa Japonica Group]